VIQEVLANIFIQTDSSVFSVRAIRRGQEAEPCGAASLLRMSEPVQNVLSARRVGPTGKAYGLDMTDDMLALARENQHKTGVGNVEFLKGGSRIFLFQTILWT